MSGLYLIHKWHDVTQSLRVKMMIFKTIIAKYCYTLVWADESFREIDKTDHTQKNSTIKMIIIQRVHLNMIQRVTVKPKKTPQEQIPK